MFTGLITYVGTTHTISPLGDGLTIIFTAPDPCCHALRIGDSISVNGVCSTVIAKTTTTFSVQYLEETLKKTTMSTLSTGDLVNLEPCLTLETPLGGHLMSGHVDTTATITQLEYNDPWMVLAIAFDASFAPYIIPKGSIAIDGISLTIVDAHTTTFTCHLIPHTIQNTHLHKKKCGDMVNLEFDMIGKYLHRFWHLRQPKPGP